MRNDIENDMRAIQEITFEAYKASGALMAMLSSSGVNLNGIAATLEKMSAQYEGGVVMLRNICEKHISHNRQIGSKPELKRLDISGKVEVNDYGWLHIELGALLPNCRYQTPAYLSDTITRLLDDYERRVCALPRYKNAMLVVDEHCDVDSRRVFDQDNKGWKAIPNALKGRLIADDDQFTLGVALMATRDKNTACHIYLLPRADIGDFFQVMDGGYPIFT
ncbi:MAG: hypothetical protein FWG48_06910 [Oscillospiraceae bacterium]|nr:hypothetical protein [Oscillospiraceae bacterium]